jgi:hypothetical protein
MTRQVGPSALDALSSGGAEQSDLLELPDFNDSLGG